MRIVPGVLGGLILILCVSLAAQITGVLSGKVTDPSGAIVPGASVTVTGPGVAARVAQTDGNGAFILLGLTAGDYAIRASAAGFNLFETSLNVPSGRVTTLDVRLQVATGRQEITVEETADKVGVDPASNAAAITMKDKDLDILSDNEDDLQTELLALAGPAAGPNGGQILVDGFSNGQLPAKESIREIRLNANPFSAEFDRSGQGRVEIFTRPGTDKFRGNFNFNFSDNAMNARNPYSPIKPPARFQQENLNVGGSLSKKASFNVEVGHNANDDANFVNAVVLDSNFQPVRLTENIVNPNHRNYTSPRLDYALTPNITLQARYTYQTNVGHNNSTGGFNLASRAMDTDNYQKGINLTETAVLGTRAVNETRFQWFRAYNSNKGNAGTPTIQVLDAFTGGGAASALNYNKADFIEIQNYTSYTRGRHFVKFGIRIRDTMQDSYSKAYYQGIYTFTSIGAYATTLQGLSQGLSIPQIQALGGGARQYSVAGGEPLTGITMWDAAPFIQEDFRVVPNITLSLGLRYEIQTNISDHHDWAPRVGIAWGIGKPNARSTPKTVIRAGFGMFYERFSQSLTLQTIRQDGITQPTFVVTAPTFFQKDGLGVPAPPVSALVDAVRPQAIYKQDANIVAPTMFQGALTLERQLPKGMTLSLNYTTTRGVHQLRSRNINAPEEGTYTGVPGSGIYPFGNTGQVFLYESSAIFKQSQVSANINARVNAKIQLFGYYSWGKASSNSDGANSFPADNYNLSTEFSRAGFDVRHRIQMGGNVVMPLGLRLSPNIGWNSAPAFNITSGVDLNGDTNFNDRPAFATDLTRPSVRITRFGNFDTLPLPGQQIVPRNFGSAYGRVDIGGRLSRSWRFGERPGMANAATREAANPRLNLTIGLQARNAINHINPSSPNGNLSSPLFGQSLSTNGGGSTSNRRLELNLRVEF